MKNILLTFDVEEFDLPAEFGNSLTNGKEFSISKKGLDLILELLNNHNIKATFFVTTVFAKKYSELIKKIHKQSHEVACHGYSHSDNYIKDFYKIGLAKRGIEKITKSKIKGFRAPRFEIKNISGLSELKFIYDSSIHPTFIPGRYCNLSKKRKIHKIDKIIEIPPSVLPIVRFPISWIFFKNFPFIYSKLFTKANFSSSDYLMCLFHSWEFVDLKNIKIPLLAKRNSGEKLIKKLEKFILFAKKNNYCFKTVEDYLFPEKSLK